MQKAEWRVEVRGEDLMPSLGLHGHPGHPGGSTPFLAPQPLQGPSKPEPRPLPPATGPPAPTFRYHWYSSNFHINLCYNILNCGFRGNIIYFLFNYIIYIFNISK